MFKSHLYIDILLNGYFKIPSLFKNYVLLGIFQCLCFISTTESDSRVLRISALQYLSTISEMGQCDFKYMTGETKSNCTLVPKIKV